MSVSKERYDHHRERNSRGRMTTVGMTATDDWSDITILCNVVDNYGDIGFVYRLARSLSQEAPQVRLRLVINGLVSFSELAPGIDNKAARQTLGDWLVLDWNNDSVCTEEFTAHPPKVILQCFQCERPQWLDDILFASDAVTSDADRTTHILNIEYLTAEGYADEFHLLKSATRSSNVKKINFMPGFTEKTAGLVLDKPFLTYLSNREEAIKALQGSVLKYSLEALQNKNTFNVLVFSYYRDFQAVVKALKKYQQERQKQNPDFNIWVHIAGRYSYLDFKKAWVDEGEPFSISKMRFIPQTAWDAFMSLMDFSFIRGEDSLSRACLVGVPFIWHAYPQTEEYQLVKVDALLDRMKPFFCAEDFTALQRMWIFYNEGRLTLNGVEAADVLNKTGCSAMKNPDEIEFESLFTLLSHYDEIRRNFTEFARSLRTRDLTQNLITYLRQLHF